MTELAGLDLEEFDFSKCDITLLLSSYGESFPNVIAEAMLYGTFPIATNIGDTKNIVQSFGDVISKETSSLEISELIYETDDELLQDNKLKIAVQVNGKLRSEIEISHETSEEEVRILALDDKKIIKYTEGKEIRKVIYIPGKILNIVV